MILFSTLTLFYQEYWTKILANMVIDKESLLLSLVKNRVEFNKKLESLFRPEIQI
jgi:hypothetical protein